MSCKERGGADEQRAESLRGDTSLCLWLKIAGLIAVPRLELLILQLSSASLVGSEIGGWLSPHLAHSSPQPLEQLQRAKEMLGGETVGLISVPICCQELGLNSKGSERRQGGESIPNTRAGTYILPTVPISKKTWIAAHSPNAQQTL